MDNNKGYAPVVLLRPPGCVERQLRLVPPLRRRRRPLVALGLTLATAISTVGAIGLTSRPQVVQAAPVVTVTSVVYLPEMRERQYPPLATPAGCTSGCVVFSQQR